MQFGVSLSGMGQQPIEADMRQSFQEIVEYIRTARQLGFDFLYQGQHYLTSPYQQLQTVPLLARLAAEAEGMGMVATLLVPLHHPVDLAERVTTMDIITNGHFHLSAALGYRDEEYDAFGVPRNRRVSRYLECLDVMRQLWTQDEVTHHGEHFHLEGARMTIRPVQQPHPPIWVAANGDAAIKRAARRGYTWYVNPHATHTPSSGRLSFTMKRRRPPAPTPPATCPLPASYTWETPGSRPGPTPHPSWAASTPPTPSGARTRPWTRSSAPPSQNWRKTGSSSATRRTASGKSRSCGIWACPTAASA